MTKKETKVAPIPRGFRAITPHITAVDVGAAVELYEVALGGTIMSVETIPGTNTVIFAQVKIGNSAITIGQGEAFGAGFVSLHHYVEDADATWTKALGAGFTELKALEETYWGDLMGLMVDPLGVRWSIGQRVVRLTAEEREERAKAAMGYPLEAPVEAEPAPVEVEAAPELSCETPAAMAEETAEAVSQAVH